MRMEIRIVDRAEKKLVVRALRIAVYIFAVLAAGLDGAGAQQTPLAQQMAQDTIARWPNGRFAGPGEPWRWNYELGTLLEGMDAMWYNTADRRYYAYIKQSVDQFVTPDGQILTYDPKAYSLDNVLLGRQLLLLYGVTQDERYYKAAAQLREQLANQPTNASGGFWHKQIYPQQMWLDGLYMGEPFFAQYALMFQEPQDFKEITKQFVLIEEHTRASKTGLLYHGWDESKRQPWANKTTGDSPDFWARGMGWYMMALVDTLPYYPESDPGRAQLLAILNRTAEAVVRYQDEKTGLWYQVLDKPGEKGNYFESSAACMFTYALAMGVRLGYLPQHYDANAERAWQGIQKQFVQRDSDGRLTLTDTVKGIGLGSIHAYDEAYSYYVSSPVASNDPKGIGAFLLAGSEIKLDGIAQKGAHQKALLDAWYNSQQRENAAGEKVYFHYKWDDYSNSGFSLFGHMLRSYGIATDTIYTAPTPAKLKDAQHYIIVSPDNPAKNPDPHYMTAADATVIAAWVKRGGVLLLMENDPANADIPHMDLLADQFGLHFNNVLTHHVIGDLEDMGRMDIPAGGPLFYEPHVLFMKDTCSLSLTKGAVPLLQFKGDILMAYAKYGKGTVYAVADPWLYNEYTDGRKLPPDYDNFGGGMELIRWLLEQRSAIVH
jgi:unsaturated rhamnogalacturonyl hydrolase